MVHDPVLRAHCRDQQKHLPAGMFAQAERSLGNIEEVLLGPQKFFHFQEALKEMEVRNFIPPIHSFLYHTFFIA